MLDSGLVKVALYFCGYGTAHWLVRIALSLLSSLRESGAVFLRLYPAFGRRLTIVSVLAVVCLVHPVWLS